MGSQGSEEAEKDHQMLNKAAENLVSLHTEIFRGQAQRGSLTWALLPPLFNLASK